MAGETQQDLPFPMRGINRSTEYELQPQGTTQTAQNVRGVEPSTNRERGGSRPGLSKFVGTRPAGVESGIQDLNVVVTAAVEALGAQFETGTGGFYGWDEDDPPVTGDGEGTPITEYPDDWVRHPTEGDPRFPLGDPYVPPGGSGSYPSPDVPPLAPPGEGGGGGSGWVYQQSDIENTSVTVNAGGGTPELNLGFNSDVQDGQLLVVGVYATEGDITEDGNVKGTALTNVQVTDSLGNSWTQVETTSIENARTPDPPFLHRVKYHMRLFWTRTNAGECDITVTLTYTNSAGVAISHGVAAIAVEYTGLENASPYEGSEIASYSAAPGPNGPVTLTAGACPVGGNTRLAIGFTVFAGVYGSGGSLGSIADGFTLRRQVDSLFPTSGFWLAWFDDTDTGVSSTPTADSPSFVAGGDDTCHVSWLASNAAFRFGA